MTPDEYARQLQDAVDQARHRLDTATVRFRWTTATGHPPRDGDLRQQDDATQVWTNDAWQPL